MTPPTEPARRVDDKFDTGLLDRMIELSDQGKPIFPKQVARVGRELRDERAARVQDAATIEALREVVQAIVDWNKKYPSSRIYGMETISRIAAEMDAINAKACEALAALSAKQGERG